ncbi:MAG TPA: HD domain-containing protein [Methanotrichaceae archaeon]|nr:HD domain-containing protein [Methanotrichaceae archaeon]
MDEDYLSFCHSWFEDYVDDFCSPEREIQESIDLKIEHTLRVCDNIATIARSLDLSGEDISLAKAIALFHDVGRFEQLSQHRTFSDGISLDHAALGLSLLEDSAVLQGLTERERHILSRAIWHHNKYEIAEDEGADILLFSRLIRDADKLDILRVITDYFGRREQQPNSALDFGLSESPGFSKELLDDIFGCRMVKIGSLKNLNDMRLMYLSWAFDLNYPITITSMLERRYLEKLMDALPQNDDVLRVRDHINGYLQGSRQCPCQ